MKNIIYILFGLTVILTSCTPKPQPLTLDEAETKLVISSQIIPNQIMVVTVSKSFGALSFNSDNGDTLTDELINQLLVSNGIVTVSYQGITDTLFAVPNTPGVYASLNTPQFLNTQYTLNVHDPETGLSVNSSEFMLEQAQIDSVSGLKGQTAGVDYIDVNLKFPDLNGTNWYMANIYTTSDDTLTTSTDPFNNNSVPTQTVLFEQADFTNNYLDSTIRIFDWTQDTLFVSVSNISEGYYTYLRQRERGGNIFTSVVGEPINYSTNINGGYGYFTTHYPNGRMLIIP